VTKCTWKDCQRAAEHPQIAKDGEEWANLCQDHHDVVEEAMGALEPRMLLWAWVNAQGGAKAASGRMVRGMS